MTASYVVDEQWAKVPVSLVETPGITLSDVRLYVHLDSLSGKRGWWYGSQEQVSDGSGLAERTIRASLIRLVEHGFLAVERLGVQHGTVNRYLVLARTVVADEQATGTELPLGDERPAEEIRSDRQSYAAPSTSLTDQTTEERSPDARAREVIPIRRPNPETAEVYSLLVECGIQRPPPRWVEDWAERGRPVEVIRRAIQTMAERAKRPSTAYVNRILEEWDGETDAAGAGGRGEGAAGRRPGDGQGPHPAWAGGRRVVGFDPRSSPTYDPAYADAF